LAVVIWRLAGYCIILENHAIFLKFVGKKENDDGCDMMQPITT
jgi:hypothetical protein